MKTFIVIRMHIRKPILATAAFLLLASLSYLSAGPVELTDQAPVSISEAAPGVILVDFGKVAFGNLKLMPPKGASGKVTFHFGEAFEKGRINRKPPGTVRYAVAQFPLEGEKAFVAAPPADARNTQQGDGKTPPAILTPTEWGVVLPFRWVEIEGWPGELKADHIVRQAAFPSDWDDEASAFSSSDENLNRIWDLCKYSIKATAFAGVYVDGDRERIPYEADSYLNQLSHYYTSTDTDFARRTYDYLMNYATWPTEWAPHMVFMAHADWMRTGDAKWLAPRYEALKKKTLLDRAGKDGLVKSNAAQKKKGDIVDWPNTERDGYVFTDTNTVVNAFHIKALRDMADLAEAVGKKDEAKDFVKMAEKKLAEFQKQLFDEKRGIYRDGTGTDHASAHANFFPLAFGIVPPDKRDGVIAFLRKKGMACSVYAAQYLMEALFDNGAADKAMELITADGDRSWKHMVNTGTTITYEAWDQKYKPNQDWNHAWGAAPANLLPRFVLGVRPLVPGWKTASISPNPGYLESAKGKIPTTRGPVLVDWKKGSAFTISVTLPEGMTAKVDLPAASGTTGVFISGKKAEASLVNSRWMLKDEISGTVSLEVR